MVRTAQPRFVIEQPAVESPRERTQRLLQTEIQFISSPVFECWRRQLPPEIENRDWERLDSTTWLSPEEELLWFRWMNYKKFRANQWRGRLSAETACTEAMDRIECLLSDAEAIRNRLITVYIKLAASASTSFANQRFAMDELMSEANAILLRCVEMFDADKGFRFSTYATHSIRRHLCRFVKQAAKLPITSPRELMELHPNQGRTLAEERRLDAACRQLDGLLSQLLDREQLIVRARFGLGDAPVCQTLQAIADSLGVSRERVRQIEQRALGKLAKLAKAAAMDELI